MKGYTRIKRSQINLNMGVAFLILFLFKLNSFAQCFVAADPNYHSAPSEISGFNVSCSNTTGLCAIGIAGSALGTIPIDPCVEVLGGTFSLSGTNLYNNGAVCSGDVVVDASTNWRSPAKYSYCWYWTLTACFLTSRKTDGSCGSFISPCSDPVPISAPQCNGGNGLTYQAGRLDGTGILHNMFGDAVGEGAVGNTMYWKYANAGAFANFANNEGTLLDGTSCNNFNSGAGQLFNFVACPTGFAEGYPPDPPSSSSGQSSSSEACNEELPECICPINPNAIVCQGSSSSEASISSSSGGYSSGGGQSSSGADLCTEFPTLPYCECQRNPSLPWCSGAVGSSGSNGGGQSSDSGFDLCTEFPSLIFCQSSDSGGGSSSPSGGSSSPSGGSSNSSGGTNDGGINFGSGNGGTNDGNGTSTTCLANNNCNWARIDVQLTQLGVETQTRDYVRDIAALQSAGYNLANEQNILLHSVLQAVNSGNADVVGALNGLASAVASASSANSEGIASQLTSWQDMLNNTFGTNGSKLDNMGNSLDSLKNGFAGGIGDGVADGLGKFAGDTAGTGEFNDGLAQNGNGAGSAMGDSLGNGLVARNKIKQAIKIDSASFAFLGNSSACPVWDLSFNAGIVSCNSCKIDLCNVYGFNAGAVIRAIIWLIALVSVLFMNLQVLKTGGH